MREKVRHRRQVRMTPTGSPVALRGRGTGKEEGSSAERLIRGSEQADCRAGLRHIVQIPANTFINDRRVAWMAPPPGMAPPTQPPPGMTLPPGMLPPPGMAPPP
ncbi:hypothetical protein THAOC_09390, partial [Thalassiosira oceanica]